MTDKIKTDLEKADTVKSQNKASDLRQADHTVFRSGGSADVQAAFNTEAGSSRDHTRINPERKPSAASEKAAHNIGRSPQQQQHPLNDATRVKIHSVNQQARHQQEVTNIAPAKVRKSPNSAPAGRHAQIDKQVLKGRFTLEKVIGVGGMGVVYKATDKLKVEARDREPHVAIKVLSEEFKTHPESFIALQRESRKTQRIAHPNVVKVYDFDRDGDTVFMTMEYMEGVPLDQLIRQYSATGLPRDEAWNILNGLCSALMYAHAENIVHSDFKPGNIFVTDSGIPKIFDFGIARAVANVDRLSAKGGDRTVFDAGSLGALTPAYASLEMLTGKEPDIRDDIYALGCIAYEIFTGSHPFNRVPADEAYKRKLRAKRIPGIKKRQWRAIEKALMFKRENRTASVEEFYDQIKTKRRSLSFVAPTLLVLTAIGISTYFIVTRESEPVANNSIQVDKIKFKIQYDLYKQKIQKLMEKATFSPIWQDSLWEQVSGMMGLLKNKPDAWLNKVRKNIYDLYIDHYTTEVQNKNYLQALSLLNNAYRYTDDRAYLDAEKSRLADLMKKSKDQMEALENKRVLEQDIRTKQRQRQQRENYLFDLAMKNVNQQLECQSSLNMREFSIAIDKLRSIDQARYVKLENNIITTLSGCITHVASLQPERAMEDKRYALRIFPDSQVIKSINIVPRDACNKSIAGLGARGERAVCRDKITGGGLGPAMVVIPGNGTIGTFAIGKYEISVREINQFCQKTSTCSALTSRDDMLPAVNIGIGEVNAYLRWLSKATKQRYRLPSRIEWMYAARANGNYLDPNRNCALNSRGIEKGGELVRANTGTQNGWGLVNYLGNAREWVYDKSHNLEAVGGSYRDSMDACSVNTVVQQSGRADSSTGFRVLREVTR